MHFVGQTTGADETTICNVVRRAGFRRGQLGKALRGKFARQRKLARDASAASLSGGQDFAALLQVIGLQHVAIFTRLDGLGPRLHDVDLAALPVLGPPASTANAAAQV